MNTKEIRIANLRGLILKYGTQKELSQESGMDSTHISNMNNGFRSMGEKTARKIEAALKLPDLWLDTDHSAITSNATLLEIQEKLKLVPDDKLTMLLGAIDAAIEKNQ